MVSIVRPCMDYLLVYLVIEKWRTYSVSRKRFERGVSEMPIVDRSTTVFYQPVLCIDCITYLSRANRMKNKECLRCGNTVTDTGLLMEATNSTGD
ncbi:hypothetical protein OUZ56_015686 [Daphnia magna]|uniref:Uncharacterized protein n=1 Tax=Daphnia magna TaxID=35525 RepID=A0ABR0ANF9_9CRUS|nr:hypothetical protein OUZ56_015686 [Daphnia magna]